MSSLIGKIDLTPDRRGALVAPLDDPGRLRSSLRGTNPDLRFRRTSDGFIIDLAVLPKIDAALGDKLQWSPLARRAASNRAAIQESAADVLLAAAKIKAGSAEVARQLISDSSLTDMLDDHQALNVAALTIPDSWGGCVFDEQGTGKTVTLIATFDLLVERNEADALLVVAPKSMIGEWAVEFERFCGGLYRVAIADGDRRAKSRAFHSGADVVVVNYETVVSNAADLELLARRCRLVLAVDESFNVKNPDARRTQAITDLREWCSRAYVLCGTPAPNSPSDIVAQFDLVDLGLTFSGVKVDPKNPDLADEIRDAMASRGLYVRNLKKNVLSDLPQRTFTDVHVEMEPEQRAAYEKILDGLIDEVEGATDLSFSKRMVHFLERRAALLRVCSDPAFLVPGYNQTPSKLAALDGILEDLVHVRREKVVLWSFYRASLERLACRYRRYGLVRIDGSVVDRNERREAVRSFQEDDHTMIFLGNPAAAGAGLTLHRSRVAVYESLSNQAAHYLQSLDRIHRRGQKLDVEYVTLLCRDSIEELEYQRLLTKSQVQAELLGDPSEPRQNRQVFLSDLLAAKELLQGGR
ncbi:DEAD/DEAH box helicase [Streptomyces sp. 16-176A]|uniref:DEAD/DEAH box helicase n=1 Tax=Streptomyces sp. 16-176A TaxID=2530458 RepID=UPI00345D2F30